MKIIFLLALFIGCSMGTLILPAAPARGLGIRASFGLGLGGGYIPQTNYYASPYASPYAFQRRQGYEGYYNNNPYASFGFQTYRRRSPYNRFYRF